MIMETNKAIEYAFNARREMLRLAVYPEHFKTIRDTDEAVLKFLAHKTDDLQRAVLSLMTMLFLELVAIVWLVFRLRG